MALVTNALPTFTTIGNQEDVVNAIYMISPTDTPFLTMAERSKAVNTLHEWQLDTLVAASTANFQLEGDVTARSARPVTTRLNNYCQIAQKDATITGTNQVVKKYGRSNEMSYQMAKATKELKRDMESSLVGVAQAKVAGNTTTPRKSASVESWLKTNSVRGVGGVSPATADGAAIPTDGTQAAFVEAMLKSGLKLCFDNGGEPTVLMVGSSNKQVVSGFTGRASQQQIVDQKTILGAASLYGSDFGTIKVVPNRFQRSRSAFLMQPDMVAVSYLRQFVDFELGKIGDAETNVMLSEYCLEMRNEAAHAVIADLT